MGCLGRIVGEWLIEKKGGEGKRDEKFVNVTSFNTQTYHQHDIVIIGPFPKGLKFSSLNDYLVAKILVFFQIRGKTPETKHIEMGLTQRGYFFVRSKGGEARRTVDGRNLANHLR